MKKLISIILCACGVATAGAPAGAQAPRNITGCYRFNRPLGTSATGRAEEGDSAWYDIELDEGGSVARSTLPTTYQQKSYASRSSWKQVGDSLRLRVFDGLTGWDIAMIRRSVGYSGTAQYLSDAVGGNPLTVHVSAERVYCYTREQLDYRPSPDDLTFAAEIAGCYELVEGAWRQDPEFLRFQPFPRGRIAFELTREMIMRELSAYEDTPYFRVKMDSTSVAAPALFTAWVRAGKRSRVIVVSKPLPMAGFALRVHHEGASLVGEIEAFTDAIPPDGMSEVPRPVIARRTSCPGARPPG